MWILIERIARTLLRDRTDDDGTAAAAKAALKVLDSVRQLPNLKQRKQLSSPSFWQVHVKQQLLPALMTLASAYLAAHSPAPGERQVRVATALATRVCANPGCLNLRGCSEGRLRSRRCSGCGVARYCSRECQVADFEVHGKVCQQLGAEAGTVQQR